MSIGNHRPSRQSEGGGLDHQVLLDTLKSASLNSAWIMVFDRDSRHANAAKFQITLAKVVQQHQPTVPIFADKKPI
jgi:hypothetical protein